MSADPIPSDASEDESMRRLQELAALGATAAGVVHEVRNVMTAVLGFAQVARHKLEAGAPSPATEPVRVIEKELRRCLSILSHFLRFNESRDDAEEPVDLRDVVGDVIHLLGHQLSLHSVEVDVRLGDPPLVRGPAGEVKQVLLNLVLNAMQAMKPGGGRVTVILDGDERMGPFITVADTGPGIASDVMARIFEPFFTTKPVGEGTGLGLSVSTAIVAKHGGTLSATSEPGHGAVFRLALPGLPRAHDDEGE